MPPSQVAPSRCRNGPGIGPGRAAATVGVGTCVSEATPWSRGAAGDEVLPDAANWRRTGRPSRDLCKEVFAVTASVPHGKSG